MKTAKTSGNCLARLQEINGDGELLSGSLIKEKAGSPEPVQELVPKLTSSEFWAEDFWNAAVKTVRAMNEQINFFIIRQGLNVNQ